MTSNKFNITLILILLLIKYDKSLFSQVINIDSNNYTYNLCYDTLLSHDIKGKLKYFTSKNSSFEFRNSLLIKCTLKDSLLEYIPQENQIKINLNNSKYSIKIQDSSIVLSKLYENKSITKIEIFYKIENAVNHAKTLKDSFPEIEKVIFRNSNNYNNVDEILFQLENISIILNWTRIGEEFWLEKLKLNVYSTKVQFDLKRKLLIDGFSIQGISEIDSNIIYFSCLNSDKIDWIRYDININNKMVGYYTISQYNYFGRLKWKFRKNRKSSCL